LGWASGSAVKRHPLETLAVTEPEQALSKIRAEALLLGTEASEQRALLSLAEANGCRVLADWACQQAAAINAVQDASAIGDPLIRIRALIVQARASNAMRDYVRGEELLSAADVELKQTPQPLLQADLALAYSSLSWQLGKFEVSAKYAEDSLVVNAEGVDTPTRIRLLRNAARARLQMQNLDQAQAHIEAALALVRSVDDPKLAGELYLEAARLYRVRGDYKRQLEATAKVITLSQELKNTQLYGQATEAEAQAHLDQGNLPLAQERFRTAARSFAELKLQRDELRIWSQLLPLSIRMDTPRNQLEQEMQRWIELETAISNGDRAKSAADFDTRVREIENQSQIAKLEVEKSASQMQAVLSRHNTQLALGLASVAAILALILGLFWWSQRSARLRVVASETRLRSVSENLPAVVAHIDREQRVLYGNAELRRRAGQPNADVVGKSLFELFGASHHARLTPYLEMVLSGERVVADDYIDDSDGRRYFQVTMVPERRSTGDVSGFFYLDQDVTDLKLAKLSLEQLANLDGLTNLMNRRYFDDKLSQAMTAARATGGALVLLLIDLDEFKPINDRFGHLAGDAVLREVARRIRLCTRREDSAARFGGDEFAVLIQGAELESGETVAKKLLAQLDLGYRHDDQTIALGASIGIAHSQGMQTPIELIEAADRALYQAKAAGKHSYQVFQGSAKE